jgi:hypothetical protein
VKSISRGLLACLAVTGCGRATSTSGGSATDPNALTSCAPGVELTGASYKLERSRFAFGSMPMREDMYGWMRWVGSDGVLTILPNGSETGLPNGGAPESSLPDWSADPMALAQHVREYFESMGVADCQVMVPQILGGSGGRDVSLMRGIDRIIVSESLAFAHFENADQTTSEGLYWPTIAAEVVVTGRAFRDRLADATALAAYKALLPADAQGDGQVTIHHSSWVSKTPFTAAATYDVITKAPALRIFDPEGNEIPQTQF